MDNSNIDKLQGDQHTLKLPRELDGSISDFTLQDDIFRPAWEFGDNQPSHPLLPDTLKEVIDPLIAEDIAVFVHEHPDADRSKLLEFRDSQMLARSFEYMGSLNAEEQVVTMAALTTYCDLLEVESTSLAIQHGLQEMPEIRIAEGLTTDILISRLRVRIEKGIDEQESLAHQKRLVDVSTRIATDPIRLHAAMYAQKLNDKLAGFATQTEDIDVYNFALDMQTICSIKAMKIMADISASMPKTTDVEYIIAPLRDELGIAPLRDESDILDDGFYFMNYYGQSFGAISNLDDPTYIRAFSQIFESQSMTPDDIVAIDHLVDARHKLLPIQYEEQESRYSYLIRGYHGSTGKEIDKEMIDYLKNDPVANFKRLQDVSQMVDDQHPEFMRNFVELMKMPRTQGILAEMLVDIMEVADTKDMHQVMSNILRATKNAGNYSIRLVYGPVFMDEYLTQDEMNNLPEEKKITDGIYKSIQLRLTEQIAAMHSLLQRGAASAVLVTGYDAEGHPTTAESTVTSLDQVILSLAIVTDALNEASIICEIPSRVILNDSQAKDNRATFERKPIKDFPFATSNEGDQNLSNGRSRTLISIRNEADTEGEARLGLTRTISIEDARNMVPALRELLGDRFDENTFLANNKKGKRMRTFSMRLDLENYGQHELSFDIGSTRKPAKEPIGYLLATVISAGAAEMARIEDESVDELPNNHIKSEFLPESANPESFGRLLKRITRIFDVMEKLNKAPPVT